MLIEIDNLKFSYGIVNGSDFSLDITNWQVNENTFTVLLGPNGSGKSTLLKILMRILPYDNGNIKLGGQEIRSINRKDFAKLVAYVPQSLITIFPYSVYEIVMMGRTPYLNFMGFEKEEDRKIVSESLQLLEISHLKHKGINEISGGELQRVIIARALAQKSKLILLDEPNAHLDIEHQIAIFNLLNKLKIEQGLTVIAVSHDLNLAAIYSDYVAFMEHGSITICGKKNEVLTEENIKKVFNIDTTIFRSANQNVSNVLVKPVKKD